MILGYPRVVSEELTFAIKSRFDDLSYLSGFISKCS